METEVVGKGEKMGANNRKSCNCRTMKIKLTVRVSQRKILVSMLDRKLVCLKLHTLLSVHFEEHSYKAFVRNYQCS